MPTVLVRLSVLGDAVHDTRTRQVDDAVGDQLGMDAEVAMVAQRRHDRVGDRADAGLDRGPVGHPFGDELGDALVDRRRIGAGATSTSGRSTSVQPTTWLTCTWLRPNVRGIRGLASRKKRARPMNDATVVGVDAEQK